MFKPILAFLLFVPLSFGADVSGQWQVTVKTKVGTGSPTVTFDQKGEQLNGTIKTLLLGESKLTGTVKGNVIEFTFEGGAAGRKVKVNYKGTIESATAMRGTAVYVGVDENATWTATKK